MLRGARIEAEWRKAPTAEDIRSNDHERLLAALLAPIETDEADRELGQRLLERKSPEEIAAALVQAHRARMPAPEELVDSGPGPRPSQGPRQGFEDTVWFRMDIGRRDNADPRWILPLLCRRGHITKHEVGAIRINAGDTLVEVPRAIADRFAEAVRRTEGSADGGDIRIEPVPGSPREQAKRNRRGPPPPRHKAKPFKGGAKRTR
jgi:ATP-dependent RNA helicase DeaD